jgi:hypothetical protein
VKEIESFLCEIQFWTTDDEENVTDRFPTLNDSFNELEIQISYYILSDIIEHPRDPLPCGQQTG